MFPQIGSVSSRCRPISNFSIISRRGLDLVQKSIVLNAFLIGLPLFFAFQIPFDGKSFGRIVPIGRIDV